MAGLNGYLLFWALLAAFVIAMIAGRPWLAMLALAAAVIVFALWMVDEGAPR